MLRYILLEGKGRKISVSDKMQKGYSYELTAKTGDLSDLKEKYGFEPELSPKEMLALGVFEGKYLNDCRKEFPADWFSGAKTSDEADPQLNYMEDDTPEGMRREYHVSEMVNFNAFALT